MIRSMSIVVHDNSLTVTMSAGIALSFEFSGHDVDEIINLADKALYQAQENREKVSTPGAAKYRRDGSNRLVEGQRVTGLEPQLKERRFSSQ